MNKSIFDELEKMNADQRTELLESMREIEKASGEMILVLEELGANTPYSDGDLEQIQKAQSLIINEVKRINGEQ